MGILIRHNMGCFQPLPRNILAMRKTINLLLSLLLLVTALLSISSYTHHSSIGVDHDFEQQDRVLHKYYRVNWTGYGSILIGYGSQWRHKDVARPLEKFDLASSFLKPAEVPAERDSFWKRMGFWFVCSASPAPIFWIGVPGWLPVLFLTLLLLIYLRGLGRGL